MTNVSRAHLGHASPRGRSCGQLHLTQETEAWLGSRALQGLLSSLQPGESGLRADLNPNFSPMVCVSIDGPLGTRTVLWQVSAPTAEAPRRPRCHTIWHLLFSFAEAQVFVSTRSDLGSFKTVLTRQVRR